MVNVVCTLSYHNRYAHSYIAIAIIMTLRYNACTYVTGPEKTGLIYTKYTYLYYGAYLFFRVCYPNSVSFIEFLRIFVPISRNLC